MIRPVLALAVLLALLFAAGCGGDDPEPAPGGGVDLTVGTDTDVASECAEAVAPTPRADGGADEPEDRLDPATTYDVVLTTNCGSLTIRLDVEGAPSTAASFVALARDGFYDDTVFHRIVPGFVIQGGDPTGSGTGGPGYKTVDAPPPDASYTRGVVAMAKTAAEAPGTAGSQFYVVTGADVGLPPEYAVLGEVVDGMDTVMRIDALGDPATERPLRAVVIERATVEES